MSHNTSPSPLRFALIGNEYQARKSVSVLPILDYLKKKGAEVLMDGNYHRFLTQEQHLDITGVTVFDDAYFDADYVVSLGGDGTFLKAAERVGRRGIPVLGVNMGRLGFLADVVPADVQTAIDQIYAGESHVEAHSVIGMHTDGQQPEGWPYALNDIAILKRDTASMIAVRCSINGQFLATYQADGLIIATPTGSTAYNLSNGGPIIAPSANTLVITPVAPHSLNIRPIVIPDSSIIELEVESRSHNFLVAIDGRSQCMSQGTRISIQRANYEVNIVRLSTTNYFSTLRSKLGWGADQR